MGEAAEKLSGKLGLDTTDFKTGLAGANRELRVLESGFRAGVAALGDWSQSATGLEARIQSLTQKIDVQKLKVAAVREEYERVKTEKGENSRAAQELEIKLNKETETLGKMQVELGTTEQSLEEMKTGTEEAGDAAESTGQKWQGWGAILQGVQGAISASIKIVLGLVAAVAAVSAGIVTLVSTSAEAADKLATMSVQTGISTDRLQEMNYIGGQLGVTIETMTGANARLVRSMDDATQQADEFAKKQAEAQQKVGDAQSAYDDAVNTYGAGSQKAEDAFKKLEAAEQDLIDLTTGEMAQAFETLGVSVTDSQGNLRDSRQVFDDVIDALGKIENPTQRDALAMQIFGKSAQELNPLIAAGADEMARMAEEAHNVGAITSEETIQTLANLSDQFDGLKTTVKNAGMELAGAFAPAFSGILSQAQGYATELVSIITGSNGDFGKMSVGLTRLFTTIAQDIASQAPQMLEAGLAIVQSILSAILAALPQMMTAATDILNALVEFIVEALPQLIPAAAQILLMLVTAIIDNLPLIVDAALKAIIALANGLAQAAPELIPAILDAVALIIFTLLQNIPALAEAGWQLILGLSRGLVPAIKAYLFPAGTQVVEDFLASLIIGAVRLVQAGIEMVRQLAQGIADGLVAIDNFGTNLVNRINQAIIKAKNSFLAIGKGIVEGVWEGIQSAGDWFFGMIEGFFQGMVDTVMGTLQEQSPSKVFAGIGKNVVLGFAQGFEGEFSRMEQQLDAAFSGLALSPAFAPAVAAATGAGTTYNVSLYGVNIGNRGRETTLGDLLDALNLAS